MNEITASSEFAVNVCCVFIPPLKCKQVLAGEDVISLHITLHLVFIDNASAQGVFPGEGSD